MARRKIIDKSEYLGMRCPQDTKRRLEEMARKRTRDLSSLALEWVIAGLRQAEQDLHREPSLQR